MTGLVWPDKRILWILYSIISFPVPRLPLNRFETGKKPNGETENFCLAAWTYVNPDWQHLPQPGGITGKPLLEVQRQFLSLIRAGLILGGQQHSTQGRGFRPFGRIDTECDAG